MRLDTKETRALLADARQTIDTLRAQRDRLLEALEEMVAEHDYQVDQLDPAKDGIPPDTGGLELARAAIASVKGGE